MKDTIKNMSKNTRNSAIQTALVLKHDILEDVYADLGEPVQKAIDNVPSDMWHSTEEELYPSNLDRLIRIKFWSYYESCRINRSHFELVKTYDGLCNASNFYQRILVTPRRVAFIFRPPTNYNIRLLESLDYGLSRIRKDVLEAPIYDKKGNFDARAGSLLLKAVEFLNIQVMGTPVQRIQQQNVNVNLNSSKEISTEEIQKKIEEIKTQNMQAVKNVGPASEED